MEYYEEVSRSDNYMNRIYDTVLKNPVVSPIFEDCYKVAASNALSNRYKAMFQVVISDTAKELKRLSPAQPDFKMQALALKRGAVSSAELIASKLPQNNDWDICISAVKAAISKIIEQLEQGGEA